MIGGGPKMKRNTVMTVMTPFDPKWPKMKFDTTMVFIVSDYIYPDVFMTYRAMSHRKRFFFVKIEDFTSNDPIWPWSFKDPRCTLSWCPTNKFASKKVQKMVTCDLWNSRQFQFCKSIFSKCWKILELEMKILINFSTTKNPNLTFLDRSRNTQKSRCSFSF